MWRKEQKADVTKRQVCNKVPPAWQAKWFVKLVAPLRGGGGMRTGIFSHQEKKLVLCWICLGDGRQDEMKLLNNFLSSSTAQLSSTFCGCGSRVLGGQQQTSLAACLGCFLLLTQMCAASVLREVFPTVNNINSIHVQVNLLANELEVNVVDSQDFLLASGARV